MTRRPGLLVVNRLDFMRQAIRRGALADRQPAVALSAADVFRRYRGFDGVAWPIAAPAVPRRGDGLAELGQWPAVERYARTPPFADENDVVVLAPHGTRPDVRGASGWRLVGFDVGFFETEWSHFSVVLNEVLWGTTTELRAFAEQLNEHLLLGTIGEAEDLVRRHATLLGEGKDVESGDVEPFAIFVPEHRCASLDTGDAA